MSNKCQTNVKQMINKCQTNVKQMINKCQTNVKQMINKCLFLVEKRLKEKRKKKLCIFICKMAVTWGP